MNLNLENGDTIGIYYCADDQTIHLNAEGDIFYLTLAEAQELRSMTDKAVFDCVDDLYREGVKDDEVPSLLELRGILKEAK